MIREEKERIAAHEEAMRRYGPVPDYTSLSYEQVLAFEHGAIWQRQRESEAGGV